MLHASHYTTYRIHLFSVLFIFYSIHNTSTYMWSFFVFFIFYHSLCLPHLLFCLYASCMYLLFYINIHLMCNYISSSGASSIEFFFFFLTQFFFHYTNKKYGSNKCLDGGISRKMWSMAHFWTQWKFWAPGLKTNSEPY